MHPKARVSPRANVRDVLKWGVLKTLGIEHLLWYLYVILRKLFINYVAFCG